MIDYEGMSKERLIELLRHRDAEEAQRAAMAEPVRELGEAVDPSEFLYLKGIQSPRVRGQKVAFDWDEDQLLFFVKEGWQIVEIGYATSDDLGIQKPPESVPSWGVRDGHSSHATIPLQLDTIHFRAHFDDGRYSDVEIPAWVREEVEHLVERAKAANPPTGNVQ